MKNVLVLGESHYCIEQSNKVMYVILVVNGAKGLMNYDASRTHKKNTP